MGENLKNPSNNFLSKNINNKNGWFKVKQAEESVHLKSVIGALCDKLKTY